jgi:phage/plasmid-like protein (TIGR03299 family)
MSHELEIVGGKASMAYANETPWHGLGTVVPDDLTSEQMLDAANLNWTVSKVPAFININDEQVDVGRSALIRSSDNSILDVVTNDWNPNQNIDAFNFFNDFVSQGDMNMETAGSLKNGQIVWALAKVNESFDLFNGKDQIDSYLLFTNPHTYGKSIDVRMTSTRVVCQNTLSLALGPKAKNGVKISHRREFIADEVKTAMGCTKAQLALYKEGALHLTNKRYTKENAENYFKEIFPSLSQKETKQDELSLNARLAMQVLDNQPGVEYGEGSWWQIFNAVTYINSHLAGRTQENRLHSLWYGQNERINVNAFNKALEYAS